MPTITIRNVPSTVRNELAARAASEGRSLQEYMLQELAALASKPTLADFIASVQARKTRSPKQIDRDQIVADRDADRR